MSRWSAPCSTPASSPRSRATAVASGAGRRNEVLRVLADDLLPKEVLARRTKAVFNNSYMTDHTHRFARRWSGAGIDHDLVDADTLRDAWLAEWPIPATAALLQAAWLGDPDLVPVATPASGG